MTWVLKTVEPHTCRTPDLYLSNVYYGSVWRCDRCGQDWLLRLTEGGRRWRRISPRKVRRLTRQARRIAVAQPHA